MNASALVQLFAPWKSIYDNSTAVSTGVTFVHVAGLLFGGGFAVAADRSTLRAVKSGDEMFRRRQVDELEAVHRPVLIALTVSVVTGVLLATADLENFLGSPVFWIKLSLVALLLGNGILLRNAERAAGRRYAEGGTPESPIWRRLRTVAWLSIVLWTAVALAGVTLVEAA